MSEHIDRAGASTMDEMRAYLDAQERLEAGSEYTGRAYGMDDTQVLNYMDTGGYPGGSSGFMQDNGMS